MRFTQSPTPASGRAAKLALVCLAALTLAACGHCDIEEVMRAELDYARSFTKRHLAMQGPGSRGSATSRKRRTKRYAQKKKAAPKRRRIARASIAPPRAPRPKRAAPPRTKPSAYAPPRGNTTPEPKQPQASQQPAPASNDVAVETNTARPTRANLSLRCAIGDTVCTRRVKTLLRSNDLAWIEQEPDAADYVSGARLVALASLRADLTCNQLASGTLEAQSAVSILATAISDERALNRSTAKLEAARKRALTVAELLTKERKQRC